MVVQPKIRVAVVGATGYAGAELVRLLARHPNFELSVLTSERDAGRKIGEVHPYLADVDLVLESAGVDTVVGRADAVFVALPHGASAPIVAGLVEAGLKVVDVGADFRLPDIELYEQWYGEHSHPQFAKKAVYGLTEYSRDAVASAVLVANPGCYPTGALLGILPLASAATGPIIIDSKSGTSGAGRAAKTEQLFAEVNENFRPYAVWEHRHQPEIQDHFARLGGNALPVRFSPHLLPLSRGLASSCYLAVDPSYDVGSAFEKAYADEPFVCLLPEGVCPELRRVRGTNVTEIAWKRDDESGLVLVMTALDNLGKGAAGQAIQNMNCMHGLAETEGLLLSPVLP